MLVHAWNPSTAEGETRGFPGIAGNSSHQGGKIQTQQEIILKQNTE